MAHSPEINEIGAALAKAQGEIKGAEKDANNTFFSSQYATLDAVWKACRTPLSRNGLAVSQVVTSRDGADYLETTLVHGSGQWIGGELFIHRPPLMAGPKNAKQMVFDSDGNVVPDLSPQMFGKLLTYLRRYALSAIVGVAPTDDDDGETAAAPHREQGPALSQRHMPRAPAPRTQQRPAAPAPKTNEMTPDRVADMMIRDVRSILDLVVLEQWVDKNSRHVNALPGDLKERVWSFCDVTNATLNAEEAAGHHYAGPPSGADGPHHGDELPPMSDDAGARG